MGRSGLTGGISAAELDSEATAVSSTTITKKAPITTASGGRPDCQAGALVSTECSPNSPSRFLPVGLNRLMAGASVPTNCPPTNDQQAPEGAERMNPGLIAVAAAAVCSGSAAVLQASAVSRLPTSSSVSAGFSGRLARSPRYLLALVLVACGFGLSILAL